MKHAYRLSNSKNLPVGQKRNLIGRHGGKNSDVGSAIEYYCQSQHINNTNKGAGSQASHVLSLELSRSSSDSIISEPSVHGHQLEVHSN